MEGYHPARPSRKKKSLSYQPADGIAGCRRQAALLGPVFWVSLAVAGRRRRMPPLPPLPSRRRPRRLFWSLPNTNRQTASQVVAVGDINRVRLCGVTDASHERLRGRAQFTGHAQGARRGKPKGFRSPPRPPWHGTQRIQVHREPTETGCTISVALRPAVEVSPSAARIRWRAWLVTADVELAGLWVHAADSYAPLFANLALASKCCDTVRGGMEMASRRRSAHVSHRLEQARKRRADQLAEQREREQRIDDALQEFAAAGETISDAERACTGKVQVYERKINELRAATQQAVAGEHARQARAALAINESGCTIEEVAELLELQSIREARRLLTAGRKALAHGAAVTVAGVADSHESSADQAELARAGGHQPRPDTGCGPASTAYGDSQSQ